MGIHPQAGKHPTPDQLTNIPRLITSYFTDQPDPSEILRQIRLTMANVPGQRSPPVSSSTYVSPDNMLP